MRDWIHWLWQQWEWEGAFRAGVLLGGGLAAEILGRTDTGSIGT